MSVVNVAVACLLEDLLVRVSREWRRAGCRLSSATQQQVHDDASAERVALGVDSEVVVVGVGVDDFRANVAWRTTALVQVLFDIDVRGQAEVAQLDLITFDLVHVFEHDVFWLKVAVNVAFGCRVRDTAENAPTSAKAYFTIFRMTGTLM